jgi:hypothetical protein
VNMFVNLNRSHSAPSWIPLRYANACNTVMRFVIPYTFRHMYKERPRKGDVTRFVNTTS